MNEAKIIARYIAGTARSKDNRGRYQNQLWCYRALLPGTTPTIAMMCAQAARAVGETIARRAA